MRLRHGRSSVLEVRRRVLASELHLVSGWVWDLGGNVTFGTGGGGGWLVEPNREKLLKLSRISFATLKQRVAFICANVHKVAIKKRTGARKMILPMTKNITWITSFTRYLHMSQKLSKVSFAICQQYL